MPLNAVFVTAGVCLLAVIVSGILLLLRKRKQSVPQDLYLSLAQGLSKIEDLARSVDGIRELFLVPRLRGGIGETILEELLKNWLPAKGFQMQYPFANGARADAVIKTGGYIIAVDSKFPLESLKSFLTSADPAAPLPSEVRRVFQKHIDDIASKYIRPEEGTLPFALMYIPSERVYYQVFVMGDSGLWAEALKRGIVPVSPGTLFLYLSTVAYGLRGFSLAENEKELLSTILKLSEELSACLRAYQTAMTHTRNLSRAMEDLSPRLSRLELIADRLKNVKTD